eukprot:1325927-Ditylum_brightwellii.AAC.1
MSIDENDATSHCSDATFSDQMYIVHLALNQVHCTDKDGQTRLLDNILSTEKVSASMPERLSNRCFEASIEDMKKMFSLDEIKFVSDS